MENNYREFSTFDMSYESKKDNCRETTKVEIFNYLYSDRSRKKKGGEISLSGVSKVTFIECIPGRNTFFE